ncbi:YwqG family protein [Corynebacterium freiburgense]|uniref:YwqG family protein n=1 Tax=Corynebacterium freiburgense TaxID=556548 RepID=UPI00047C2491|nr:DUF1963 domain-containing protein [Corynebacterium freiburgense]WJZ01742.1 hypothetical protein CFREI_02190 [Corynebacterium freiburgense]
MTFTSTFQAEIPQKFEPYRAFLESNTRRTTLLHLSPVVVDDRDSVPTKAKANPTGSRIGGPAVVTDNHPWPLDTRDKAMMHLAQINLAEMPIREGYPTDGLLQFFHADDEAFGIDHGGNLVRYLPATELENSRLEGTLENQSDAIYGDGYFEVEGQLFDQFPLPSDYQFPEKGFPEDSQSLEYGIWDLNQPNNIFGGGWAYFTQEDPRYDSNLAKSGLELLLQIDSTLEADQPIEIMFGDAGVANFFIHPNDLAKLDFSQVFYTWDCC